MNVRPAPDVTPAPIAPPEPDLTPADMIARATALRGMLRARQVDCEALGRVPDDVNAELIRAGFYRTSSRAASAATSSMCRPSTA